MAGWLVERQRFQELLLLFGGHLRDVHLHLCGQHDTAQPALLGRPGELSKLQTAFIEHTAFGCGYCTPGMIVTAEAFLSRNPRPSRAQIVGAMDDNLCRCASYPKIVEAIQSVAGTNGKTES